MLKTLFARLARRVLVAIAVCGLLFSTAACDSATPEELPKLESVTERLERQSGANRSATSTEPSGLTDAAPGESDGAATTDLSADVSETAVPTAEDTAADLTREATESARKVTDEMQQQLEVEKDTIQQKLEAANQEAAQALDAELKRASEAFDEELSKAKSKLQPVLEETPDAVSESDTVSESAAALEDVNEAVTAEPGGS